MNLRLFVMIFLLCSYGSAQDLESRIETLLRNPQYELGSLSLRRGYLKYVDLNNDGHPEVIAMDNASGSSWGRFYVLQVDPLELHLIMEGEVGYKVLETTTNGYRDIEGVLRGGSKVYRWQGQAMRYQSGPGGRVAQPNYQRLKIADNLSQLHEFLKVKERDPKLTEEIHNLFNAKEPPKDEFETTADYRLRAEKLRAERGKKIAETRTLCFSTFYIASGLELPQGQYDADAGTLNHCNVAVETFTSTGARMSYKSPASRPGGPSQVPYWALKGKNGALINIFNGHLEISGIRIQPDKVREARAKIDRILMELEFRMIPELEGLFVFMDIDKITIYLEKSGTVIDEWR
jgi:hypothetical protein